MNFLAAALQNTKSKFYFLVLASIPNSPNPELRGFGSGSLCPMCRRDGPAGCVPAGSDAGCVGAGPGGHLSLDRLLQAG